MRMFALALAAIAAGVFAAPAEAQLTTTNYSFTSTNAGSGTFSVTVNSGALYDPLNPPSITLAAFNYTLGTTTFTLADVDTYRLNPTQIAIGGTDNGVLSLTGISADDFVFDFNACIINGPPGDMHCVADTNTQTWDIAYRIGAFPNGVVTSDRITVMVAGALPSGVPEPAAWAMMLLGFAGMGLALRRQRRFVTV